MRRYTLSLLLQAITPSRSRLGGFLRVPRGPSLLVGPIAVSCPRCKSVEGELCDARTLGRYSFHRARRYQVEGKHECSEL